MNAEGILEDAKRAGEGCIGIADGLGNGTDHIRPELLVQQRWRLPDRLLGIEHHGKIARLDVDENGPLGGLRKAFGKDDGNPPADIADLAEGHPTASARRTAT